VREASKLGFKRIVVPRTFRPDDSLPKGVEIIKARTVVDALETAMPKSDRFSKD
jgi:predicted ATP-dependent serine protease